MAINIKELFVTDLDPNSGAWWSKDKVDKINYNFNLLSNGGMPGPQGTIGADGGFGLVGAQGYIGYKGPQGYQGHQGAGSLNDWEYFPEASGLPGYLYPRKNPIGAAQSAPVALRIGYINDPGIDPGYDVGENPQSPIQIVKVIDNNWVNLKVEENNSFRGYNFSFKSLGSFPRFEISPDITGPEFTIIHSAQTILFRTGIAANTLNDSITITNSQITINTGGITGPDFNLSNVAGKFTKSLDEFRFTPGAATNKVLVSTDTSGNVEWKNVKDVFGTFPIGSIVSIRESEFNTNHFWLNDSVNVTSGSPLNNIYGRGKVGTDYEGWYLCNGEIWETEQGFNQYLTPNLNNFSYTIDANGDAQNLITVPESDPVLIGGYDMGILAVPNISGIYNVEYSTLFFNNDTSPGSSTISMTTPGDYSVSRMIHIVYLENPNLKWSNTGVYVPPITTNPILLTLPLTTPLAIANQCTAPVTTNYSWTGPNSTDWNTFTIPSTYKLFNFNTTTYASAGWYVNIDGYPIYWDGTDFTLRGTTCGSTSNLRTFYFAGSVSTLNGPIGVAGGDYTIDLNIDTPLFINATSLVEPNAYFVEPGWYRESTSGVRRYWDGSQFLGVSFDTDYVSRLIYNAPANDSLNNFPRYISTETFSPGETSCNATPLAIHTTYLAGNSIGIFNTGGGVRMQHVIDFDSALYVGLDWADDVEQWEGFGIDATIIQTPPLINVKDQLSPDGINYYDRIRLFETSFSGYQRPGTISLTTGKVTSYLACTSGPGGGIVDVNPFP